MRKIGLYGGAFNPPHNEHVAVLNSAKKELNLDFCIVFPSFDPPHKNTTSSVSFESRMEMCSLAFKDAIISDIEKNSLEKNYAVNTVKKFQELYPEDKLVYVIGGDSMADLFKWYQPETLLSMVDIAVYPREGRIEDMNEAINKAREVGGNITVLSYVGENISSREIRALASLGFDISDIVPREVSDYVCKNALYKNEYVDIVKANLPQKTVDHVFRTVKWALRLNRNLGLSVEDVFLATLFHDITKKTDTTSGVPEDAISTPVAHQFSGAEYAKRLGFNDKVVQAIRYHTTGREDMTTLEKLVYVADMTEEGREFDGVEKLRSALLFDFEKGFVECLNHSYEYLVNKGENIYYLTKNAYEYYKNR